MATKAPENPVTALEALRGSLPLSQIPRQFNVPKSSIYRDAREGKLKTFTTASGLIMVKPEDVLAYLQGNGEPPRRGRPFAKEGRA
jgi:hypothetical protein